MMEDLEEVQRVQKVVDRLAIPARVRNLSEILPDDVQVFATAYHPVPDTVVIFMDRVFGRGAERRVETAVAAVGIEEVTGATDLGLEVLVGRRVGRAMGRFRADPMAGCGDYRPQVRESLGLDTHKAASV